MSNRDAVSFDTTLFVRDHCLCLAAQRAARSLARRFDDALGTVGLTSGQFSLLNALNRPDPPSIGSVAALLAMDRTTLTANLKPLQRRGLVTVAVDGTDRRSRRLALTKPGHEVLASAVPIWRDTHRDAERLFVRTDGDTVRAGLGDLYRGEQSRRSARPR